jgi:hypothetical protein
MRKLYTLLMIVGLGLYSCEEIIMEDDISGKVVELVAPYNGAELNSTGITFTWNPIENGTQYQIQIAKPNFTNPQQIVTDTTIDTTSFTTQLNVGQYEWRVRAINSAYATVYSTRLFAIVSNEDFQNNNVTLTSPTNNLITNVASQNLVWQSVIGATAYHLQVVDNSTSVVTFEQDLTNTNYTYTFPEGNYSWKVRATNGSQNTLYAMRSLLVDTTAPNTPTLSLPANASTTTDNNITFQWSRTPIAGSAEKDSIYIYSNPELTNVVYEGVQTNPYTTSTLQEGTYYWYVKSSDEAGNVSQQSSVFSFTIN